MEFEDKCRVLGELWFSYRQDEAFADFIEYNDVGLPMAYLAAEELASPEPQGMIYIEETWDLLISALEVDPEGHYEDLEALLKAAEQE